MFSTFEGRVRAANPKMKRNSDDSVDRYVQLLLQCELDDDMAAGLGDPGKDARRHLKSGVQKSAAVLLDSLGVEAKFSGSSGNHELRMTGVKARCAAARKEGAAPVVTLEFRFKTMDEDLLYFVHNVGELVKVDLKRWTQSNSKEQKGLKGVK